MTDPQKRRPLAEISEDIYRIIRDAEETDGDLTASEPLLDALDLEFADKAEAYVAVLRRLDAEADACKSLTAHYAAREVARRNQHASLKARLMNALTTVGVTELKTPTCKVWLQESASLELSEEWFASHRDGPFVEERTTLLPRKNLIKASLLAGADIPGARIVINKHLRHS